MGRIQSVNGLSASLRLPILFRFLRNETIFLPRSGTCQRVGTNCPPPCCTNAWRPSERKFRQSGRNVPHHPVHPFLGLWERFHNSDFNYIEFEAIETEAGLNSFVLTPKRWVEQTTYWKSINYKTAEVDTLAVFGFLAHFGTILERRGIAKNDVVENHYLCKENIQFV